jgi:hypothetical protein
MIGNSFGWEVRFILDVPISEISIKEIDGISFETAANPLGIELKGFRIIIPATNEAEARILAEGKANRIFDYLSWIHNRPISGYFSGMTEIRPAGEAKRGIAASRFHAISHNPVDLDFSLILDVLEGRDEKLLRQLGHFSLGLKAVDIISKYREFYQVIEDEQYMGDTSNTQPIERIEDIDGETIKRVIRNLSSHPILSKNKKHASIAATLLGRPYLDMSNINDKTLIEENLKAIKEEAQKILIPKLNGIMVTN